MKSIKEREHKCLGAISLLQKMGHRDSILGVEMLMRVLYARVVSIMEYGCVVWSVNMNNAQWGKLEAKLNDGLRAVLGLERFKVANVVIHGDLGVPSLEGIVRKRLLLWKLDMMKMNSDRIVR